MVTSKSGAPRSKAPRHTEHNARGSAANPYGKTADKAELLQRLKEAATRKKKEEEEK